MDYRGVPTTDGEPSFLPPSHPVFRSHTQSKLPFLLRYQTPFLVVFAFLCVFTFVSTGVILGLVTQIPFTYNANRTEWIADKIITSLKDFKVGEITTVLQTWRETLALKNQTADLQAQIDEAELFRFFRLMQPSSIVTDYNIVTTGDLTANNRTFGGVVQQLEQLARDILAIGNITNVVLTSLDSRFQFSDPTTLYTPFNLRVLGEIRSLTDVKVGANTISLVETHQNLEVARSNITVILGRLGDVDEAISNARNAISQVNSTNAQQFADFLALLNQTSTTLRGLLTDQYTTLTFADAAIVERLNSLNSTFVDYRTATNSRFDGIDTRIDHLNTTVQSNRQLIDSASALLSELTTRFNSANQTLTTQYDSIQTQLTSLTSSLNTFHYIIHVSLTGSDTTGTGSMTFPYRTIQRAIVAAGNSTDTSVLQVIRLDPGLYNEVGTLFIPPGVCIDGITAPFARIATSTGFIMLSPHFSTIVGARMCMKDVTIDNTTSILFDLAAHGGTGTASLALHHVFTVNDISIYGRGADRDNLLLRDTGAGSSTIRAVTGTSSNHQVSGNLVISDAGATSSPTNGLTMTVVGGRVGGSTTFAKTLNLPWTLTASGWGTPGSLTTTVAVGTMTINVDFSSRHGGTHTLAAGTSYNIKNIAMGRCTLGGSGQCSGSSTLVTATNPIVCTIEKATAPGVCYIESRTVGTSVRFQSGAGNADNGASVNYIILSG
jgi:hypothetical protein